MVSVHSEKRQFNSVQDGICVLRKAYILCTPPWLSEVFPSLAFETVPGMDTGTVSAANQFACITS